MDLYIDATIRTDAEGLRQGRLYAGPIPPGSTIEGLVIRADGMGALVRLTNGVRVQLNAGVVRTLPPRLREQAR